MNKTIAWILVYGAVGYGAYYLLTKKKRDAKTIAFSGSTKGSVEKLMTFDRGYLAAWAKAAKNKQPEFTYNNTVYVTQGGATKKK